MVVVVVVVADLPQVEEGDAHALGVGPHVVLDAVLLEESTHARRDLRVAVLRHAGEEVMLDLEVEIGHPPVAPPAARAVGRVVGGVERPRDMLALGHDILVGVAHGEVGEDVGRAHSQVDEVERERVPEAGAAEGPVPDGVAHRHPSELEVVLNAQRVVGVEDELPGEGDQRGDDAPEEERRLRREPQVGALLAEADRVEGHQRHRRQVRVGP
mmetsp:Transcript_31640/g.75290  ORF Transcript_31640/g.75290 Transcript_31640/m.75290 type:complete len:213 (+) Transcript_31640:206-844(+)